MLLKKYLEVKVFKIPRTFLFCRRKARILNFLVPSFYFHVYSKILYTFYAFYQCKYNKEVKLTFSIRIVTRNGKIVWKVVNEPAILKFIFYVGI